MATVLGIDGGGTKTIFALANEKGEVLGAVRGPTISMQQCTAQELSANLREGIGAAKQAAGLPEGEGLTAGLDAAAVGMPSWGESALRDGEISRVVRQTFGALPHLLVNDAEVGWAGSLALAPGINVVAGTGAIAFGVDPQGASARSGGWDYHYSDEGSGYWLSRRLLELFCKQADGRIPQKGPVYHLVVEALGLHSDFDLIDIIERDYLPYRDKFADLQRMLLQAALAGDAGAVDAYREAGEEIALCALGVLRALDFGEGAEVSYSGGIFKVGELLLQSFRTSLARHGCRLVAPKAPPWVGALMMALRHLSLHSPAAIARLSEPKPEP